MILISTIIYVTKNFGTHLDAGLGLGLTSKRSGVEFEVRFAHHRVADRCEAAPLLKP